MSKTKWWVPVWDDLVSWEEILREAEESGEIRAYEYAKYTPDDADLDRFVQEVVAAIAELFDKDFDGGRLKGDYQINQASGHFLTEDLKIAIRNYLNHHGDFPDLYKYTGKMRKVMKDGTWRDVE